MTPSVAAGDRIVSEVTGARNRLGLWLAMAGLVITLAMTLSNRDSWSVDFTQFYTAGSLAGTGHIYDWPTVQAAELKYSATAVPYLRLPFFAFGFKLLSLLPYPMARALFLGIELAALAGFAALWPSSQRGWVFVAVCWSAPASMCLSFGQDTVLFLFAVTFGLNLLMSHSETVQPGARDFWAGVALSFCASKPHLAVLIPVVLIACARWKAILGGMAGCLTMAVLSFCVEGFGWPAAWLAQSRLPDFEHAVNRMPNLRGLLSFLGGSFALELAMGVIVAIAVYFLSRRLPLRISMAVALAGGLLLSHHAYVYDCPVLLPALLLAFEERVPEWLRMWAVLLITPIPYMLILTNSELPGHLMVTGYAIALIVIMIYSLRTPADSLRTPLRSQ
jgi:hypothetical protein